MKLVKKAYAKINLTLDVVGKRKDGYHDIMSIMQTIGLCDTLTMEKRDEGIEISWDKENEIDDKNTIRRAIDLMFGEFGIKSGIAVRAEKKIPFSAGLAGGSADAAAAIEGINELFNLGIRDSELISIGAKIGADVPFCIKKGAAMAEGIGERLIAIDSEMQCHVVLVKPNFSISTKQVYDKLDSIVLFERADVNMALTAIQACDYNNLGQNLNNVMELVTAEEHPIIKELKRRMKQQGAFGQLMSGSGPTVFGLFENKIPADNARYFFKNNFKDFEVLQSEFYYPQAKQ